jgi:hypothetical protein
MRKEIKLTWWGVELVRCGLLLCFQKKREKKNKEEKQVVGATQTLKKSRSHAKVIWHIFIIFEGNGMLEFFWQVFYKIVGTMAS